MYLCYQQMFDDICYNWWQINKQRHRRILPITIINLEKKINEKSLLFAPLYLSVHPIDPETSPAVRNLQWQQLTEVKKSKFKNKKYYTCRSRVFQSRSWFTLCGDFLIICKIKATLNCKEMMISSEWFPTMWGAKFTCNVTT